MFSAHRGVGQESVLRDVADGAPQVLQVDAGDRLAVEPDLPALRFVEAQQQLDQRALAAAGAADEGDGLAGGDR